MFGISVYAQPLPAPCGPGYSISVSAVTGCSHMLQANVPDPSTILDVTWIISTTGTNVKECERFNFEPLNLLYDVCFNGTYNIKAIIHKDDGSYCTISQNLYLACINSISCANAASTNPAFHYAYMDAGPCNGQTYTWFMFWPVTEPTCKGIYTYKLYYETCTGCTSMILPDAKVCNVAIKNNSYWMMEVSTNHCCFPNGWKKYYKGFADVNALVDCRRWCGFDPRGCLAGDDLYQCGANMPPAGVPCFSYFNKEIETTRLTGFEQNNFASYYNGETILIQSKESIRDVININIYTLDGKLVKSLVKKSMLNGETIALDLPNQNDFGIYLLEIKGENYSQIQKIIRI